MSSCTTLPTAWIMAAGEKSLFLSLLLTMLICIILGTGFIVDPRIYMKDFVITGLPGHTLSDDWRDGAQAYYGQKPPAS